MNDIKVGCARWYGVLYPSTSVPQGDYEKNNIIYNVDNDFYDNKYPPNMYGKYFCIMERNVTQWKKYESVSDKSKNLKNNQCKILMFRQKIK